MPLRTPLSMPKNNISNLSPANGYFDLGKKVLSYENFGAKHKIVHV